MLIIFIFLQEFVANWLPWLAPLVMSSGAGAVAGYGSFRFGQGELRQRVMTLERDATQMTQERAEFVTRNEFKLLRDDLREIKIDMREVRRSLGGK